VTDAASSWPAFLASSVAPQRAITLHELDGYPTAVIVAPSLILPDALHARQFLMLRLVHAAILYPRLHVRPGQQVMKRCCIWCLPQTLYKCLNAQWS
jgi:hypothetical protein